MDGTGGSTQNRQSKSIAYSMNTLEIIFWIFGIGILAGATLVAFSRNLIHAAGGLFLTLFSVAGIFIISGADFLGIVQLIVYVGGVLILILFGVMLSRKFSGEVIAPGRINSALSLCIGILLAGLIIALIMPGDYTQNFPENAPIQTNGSTTSIGVQLLTQYLLPFEFVSFLLLTALVGSAWLARRKPAQPRDTLQSGSNQSNT
jgi:NADH-quinone oxidoreductase subunit J